MNASLRTILIAQAEKLLLVMPGAWSAKPIEWVRAKVHDMYDEECKNTAQASEHVRVCAQKLTTLMWHWMEACDYALKLGNTAQADPSMLGIEQIHLDNGVTCIATYCRDYKHFKSIPSVVVYKGTRLGKTGWNSDTNRCYFKSNAPIAMGIC